MDAKIKQLLETYQRGFPLAVAPYQEMAEHLNMEQEAVLETLKSLQQGGVVSRVGPVFNHRKVGFSTLAAMSVPEQDVESIAALINSYQGVNHNYEREHHFNLWFVVTASSIEEVTQIIADIEQRTGIEVMDLPMEAPYHIDLGFI